MGRRYYRMRRGARTSTLIVLCLCVVGLSIGFSAFSSQLVIRPSATVKPVADNFKLVFSDAETPAVEGTGVTATNATIGTESSGDGSISVIKDMTAKFTEPGQKVFYRFVIKNVGEYKAFLNKVIYGNATGASEFKKCTPGSGTDATKVAAACEHIGIELVIGGDTYSSSNDGWVDNSNISGKSIEPGSGTVVHLTIHYGKDSNGDTLADGDFNVSFGDITLEYGSVD